ncbi:hypothetical protein HPB47_013902, partial [Ixodes persulcatus]
MLKLRLLLPVLSCPSSGAAHGERQLHRQAYSLLTGEVFEKMAVTDATFFAKRLREATADSVEMRFGLAPVGSPLSYQHSLVPFGYETYISPELSLVQRRITALPSEPAFFESGVAWDTSEHNFPSQQDLLLKSLLVTSTQAAVLEKNTRQQSRSPLWRAARRNWLTASSFGEGATRESWSLKGLNNLTSTKDISHVREVSVPPDNVNIMLSLAADVYAGYRQRNVLVSVSF